MRRLQLSGFFKFYVFLFFITFSALIQVAWAQREFVKSERDYVWWTLHQTFEPSAGTGWNEWVNSLINPNTQPVQQISAFLFNMRLRILLEDIDPSSIVGIDQRFFGALDSFSRDIPYWLNFISDPEKFYRDNQQAIEQKIAATATVSTLPFDPKILSQGWIKSISGRLISLAKSRNYRFYDYVPSLQKDNHEPSPLAATEIQSIIDQGLSNCEPMVVEYRTREPVTERRFVENFLYRPANEECAAASVCQQRSFFENQPPMGNRFQVYRLVVKNDSMVEARAGVYLTSGRLPEKFFYHAATFVIETTNQEPKKSIEFVVDPLFSSQPISFDDWINLFESPQTLSVRLVPLRQSPTWDLIDEGFIQIRMIHRGSEKHQNGFD